MRDEQTADSLLAALIQQFPQEHHPHPDPITGLHEVREEEEKKKPLQDQVRKALIAVAKSYDRTFVVVDALDACSEQTRGELLSSIRQVQKEASINFLATSRPVPGIGKHFQGGPRLQIRANENDVEIYLQSRLQELPGCAQEDETLQQNIKRKISEAIDEM